MVYTNCPCNYFYFLVFAYDTTRTHFTEGIKAKLDLAFISAIVWNELVKARKAAMLSTNRMVNELNQICMYMGCKNEYFVCHTENKGQILLMNACGVIPQDLDRIAEAKTGEWQALSKILSINIQNI